MPSVIGTVTRATAITGLVNSPGDSQSNRCAFVARNAQGKAIGSFRSAGEAQQSVATGYGQLLKWTREDLRGGIEHYVGRTLA